ncbi:hypothetical protein EVAR_79254_1 [Eumeta japonica]|uniref:Uncharacterized protein n=1 Tax=Eumeta variegata TaxID=151549 RepID=A0A4C1TFN0_EUMVA|nr:hypothetical protein EVAR_79254_1 [Eumeta japonica]
MRTNAPRSVQGPAARWRDARVTRPRAIGRRRAPLHENASMYLFMSLITRVELISWNCVSPPIARYARSASCVLKTPSRPPRRWPAGSAVVLRKVFLKVSQQSCCGPST